MQVVINIEDEIYWRIVEDNNNGYGNHVTHAIRYGTPLPKGHGRLIDADALPLKAIDDANYGSNYIRIAPTIIEADKAESEG